MEDLEEGGVAHEVGVGEEDGVAELRVPWEGELRERGLGELERDRVGEGGRGVCMGNRR